MPKLTPTGRTAKSSPNLPNLQQIPIRTEEGKAIRDALLKELAKHGPPSDPHEKPPMEPTPSKPPEVITIEHLGTIIANIAKERENWAIGDLGPFSGPMFTVIHHGREVIKRYDLDSREACQLFISAHCLGTALRTLGLKVELFNPKTNKLEK